MHEDPRSDLTSGQSVTGVGLADVLPLLVGPARTGRLYASQDDGPTLEVWIAGGRVVHATWGPTGALSALEMAAVFLPQASYLFSAGHPPKIRSFDLSPADLALRLARVAREGAALTEWVPGPRAVPAKLPAPAQGLVPDRGAERLLDQIDGRRTVAELVNDQQPLTVVRELASLVMQGAITFEPVVQAPVAETVAAEPPVRATPVPTAPDAAPRAGTSSLGAPAATRLARMIGLGLAVGVLIVLIIAGVQTQLAQPERATPTAPPIVAAPTSTLPSEPTPTPAALIAAPAAAPTQQPTPPPTAAPTQQPTPPPTAAATQQPTPPPTAAPTQQPTQGPTAAAIQQPTQAPTAAATQQPTSAPSPTLAARVLLDETFGNGAPGWPNAANSPAFWDSLTYHLDVRLVGRHVAIAAPLGTSLGDIAVTGLFRKSGGPVGGGYGLVLRAQGATLDGTNQGGRYYVFEVGDRGEVGAWRREEDRWVELLPWTASNAVTPGLAANRLDVRAIGSRFTFSVNNVQVAELTDPTLASGAVGAFAGGDGNQVLLERFTVTAL